MADILPAIDEVVGLLQRSDPEELRKLISKFPSHQALFKPGAQMGTSRSGARSADSDNIEMEIRAETALIGVESAQLVCVSLISEVQRLINKVNRLQLAMQILTLVSGASIFVVLKSEYGTTVTYILAAINLAASIVGLVAKHIGGRDGGARKPAEDYKLLIECRLQAEQICVQLRLWKGQRYIGVPPTLIQQANQVAFKINQIESHNYRTSAPAQS